MPCAAGRACSSAAHLGNFEPFGSFLAAHGLRPLSPIEEIEPRALFEFLAARRGASSVDLVPLREATRAAHPQAARGRAGRASSATATWTATGSR